MPYPTRLQLADVVYHVWVRATKGLVLAVDAEDRERLIRLLGLAVVRFGWRCHMYCVLGTHFHLVLQTPQANIAAGMQWLNGVYVLVTNRRHGRYGHLVSERYSTKIVETEEHALELTRYIPLNPVEAGLCALPEQWRSSSYAATIGRAKCPPWLDPSWVLDQFDGDTEVARARLADWVKAGLEALKEGRAAQASSEVVEAP